MGLLHSPSIPTNDLLLCVDAANKRSYSGAGTTWSSLVRILDGTLTNGPTFSSDNSGFISLDGGNDYVDFGNDVVTPALPFSLQCWVNFPTLGVNEPIFTSSYHSSNRYGFSAQKNTSNQIVMHINDGGVSGPAARRTGKVSSPTLVANTWYNLAFVWRGATDMSIYYDAVSQTVAYEGSGGSINYSSNKPAQIGHFFSHYGEVKISQLLVYGRELSEREILQIYKATKGRYQ
tara:strand:- start:90 stop:788 length:699 start_codon:yes stop_codon:yes gene_type:complete